MVNINPSQNSPRLTGLTPSRQSRFSSPLHFGDSHTEAEKSKRLTLKNLCKLILLSLMVSQPSSQALPKAEPPSQPTLFLDIVDTTEKKPTQPTLSLDIVDTTEKDEEAENKAKISCINKPLTPVKTAWKFPNEIMDQIKQMGLSGKNIKGIILETVDNAHATQVFNSAKAVAPNLDLDFCFFTKGRTDGSNISDVGEYASSGIDTISDAIEALIQKKETKELPNLRLINMSLALSKKHLYEKVQKANETQEIWGFAQQTMKLSHVIPEVEYRLDESTELKNALARYKKVTCEAAANGITIITGSANEQKRWTTSPYPEAEFNYLGMTPCAITAAAFKSTNNTKNSYSIADFSSAGSKKWHPTISAFGEKGTSQASPFVFGTLGLALEKNAILSFQQQKTLLESTATDTPEPIETEGAGMINPSKLLASIPQTVNKQNLKMKKPLR